MIRWEIISLVLLVGLAGCSAGPLGEPTPQQEPASVKLVNNATQIETFTVAVAKVNSKVTIQQRGGRIYNITVSSGSYTRTVSGEPEDEMVKVSFPNAAHIHGNYTLGPGQRKQIPVTDISPDEAIVVLVYDTAKEEYRSIKSLSCDGPILGYEVASQSGGDEDWTWSKHSCGMDWI